MTIWEYAIARVLAQLLSESETRVLTAMETLQVKNLTRLVESYETRENAEVQIPGRRP